MKSHKGYSKNSDFGMLLHKEEITPIGIVCIFQSQLHLRIQKIKTLAEA
jgi:hypothetical protein